MKKEIYICDNCNKEDLGSYLEIKDGSVQRGSGREAGSLIGYYVDKIQNKIFCSITCLDTYIHSKMACHYGSARDRWELGEEPEPERKEVRNEKQ